MGKKNWKRIHYFHNYSTLNINGDIIIAGSFMGEMDFDPNTSEKLFNSKFGQTYFISLDQDGNFKWLNQIENMFGNININVLKTDKREYLLPRNLGGTVDIDPRKTPLKSVGLI
ncbi:MAG: hypothetical protein IPL95_18860 [Saprospiraceae bacterium]|nr:hypothetical protein [Saprospiraceae bacterium]